MIETTTTELKMLDKAAREFSRKALKPDRDNYDRYPFAGFFDIALEKAFEAGFLQTTLPEEFGGLGRDLAPLCVILYQICQEDASMGGIVLINAIVQEILQATDSLELVEERFKDAESARSLLVGYPLFQNPDDLDELPGVAKDSDQFTISGLTDYLVLGGIADQALVPGLVQGDSDYSFFLVDLAAAGVEKSEPVLSLGLHACPAVDVSFGSTPCRLVGEQGKGPRYFGDMYHRMLLAAAAMSAGIMKSSFEEALDYARKRSQGGREIIHWSEVRMMLANLAYRLKISEMSISEACRAEQSGKSGWMDSSDAAALYSLDLACDFTSDGIQLLGGYGYTKDYAQEKRFRDAQQLQAVLGMSPMKKLKYIGRVI